MKRKSDLLEQFIYELLSVPINISSRENNPSNIRHGVCVRTASADASLGTPQEADVSIVWITKNDEKILAVSRGVDSDKYAMPGGHVEEGETPEQAAIRELKEETGLDLLNPEFIFSDYNSSGMYVCVYGGEYAGEIRGSDEGHVEWVSVNTLLEGPYFEFMKKLLKYVGYQ